MSAPRRRGENCATRLLDKYGKVRVPVPVREIAISEGCVVRSAILEDELSGMAFIAERKPVIVVNSGHHPNRQRFTIAHELGHHLMHQSMFKNGVHVDKGILRRDSASATGELRLEIEANSFAAALLMPQSELTYDIIGSIDIEDDESVSRLAGKFGVSVAAMTNRILNMLD